SIIYNFSNKHYNLIFFVLIFFILGTIAIIFGEHLYTIRGWGLSIKEFIHDLPIYIGLALFVGAAGAVIKYFSLFGIPSDLGGSFMVFSWSWRDLIYPITVPIQEMGARALPHTILRNVLKGTWHKTFTIIMITSLIFGLSHISFGFSMVILTFLLGIFLGCVFEWKRNFWGICLVHMVIGYLIMTGLGFDLLVGLN
ncbi:CPBP family intramembrane glutamic endopeptidase, partial [Nanoarchaeota archaeon]